MRGAEENYQPRRSPLFRASIIVIIVGVVLSVTSAVIAKRVVDGNERRLFLTQSTITAEAMSATTSSFENGLASAAAVGAVTHGSPGGFDRTVSTPQFDTFSSIALWHQAGGVWTPTAIAKPPVFPVTAADLTTFDAVQAGQLYILGFRGTGPKRTLSIAYRATADPSYLVFAEITIGNGIEVGGEDAGGFKVNFALYVTGSEQRDTMVWATTPNLPLHGGRAALVLDISGQSTPKALLGTKPGSVSVPSGKFLMVTAPDGVLSGRLTLYLPWILLGFGLVMSFVGAASVERVRVERDRALGLVDDLELKNDALDQAMEERDTADKTRADLETQLRQAQRLEAVGQLAGGIAHDFNNLLAVILNYGSFAAEELVDHPAKTDVDEIVRAARRAADLTRQLLIFSRRDVVKPEILDFTAVLDSTKRLLERTLSEDISLRWDLAPTLPWIEADAGELEQVLLNLVVNARDAMRAAGGTLTISTSTEDVADRPGGPADGRYVRLVVEDTGCGIDSSVLPRVFEPFFTTKGPGEGTGMGLATVYGIVQRWRGHVSVVSEPGKGTRFTVLFPAAAAMPAGNDAEPVAAPRQLSAAAERIGLVEDEEPVRRAARRILERNGYTVIEAASGAEALERFGDVELDLLITDVIMPGGVSGKDLAKQLEAVRPGLPVIYMSGYTADLIADRGVLDPDVTLLEKPFDADVMLGTVQAVLAASGTRQLS